MRVGFPIETKKRKKEESLKKLIFTKKFWGKFFCGIGIVFLSIIICKSINYFFNRHKLNLLKDDIVNEVCLLAETNKQYISKDGEKYFVEKFDLKNNTLPFKNFASENSPGGNCEGYNIYELLHFEGRLEEFLGNNLKSRNEYDISSIIPSEKDSYNIYSNGSKYDATRELKHFNDYVGTINNIDYNKIVELSFKDNNVSLKVESDFKDKKFENEKLKNILYDITFLHDNKISCRYATYPYYSSDPVEIINKKNTNYLNGDINYIKQTLENNKLIVLGINNKIAGHALLAYGYEKIDENNYKIYVKDSNIPLIKKEILSDIDIKVNNDIENNCYILFTKDILEDRWSYIYQPNINGVELYGYYNSFVPGTKLNLLSIE